MGVLMVVVVPKITSIFEDMGKTLPWNTQLLIFISDLIGSYWWALIIFWRARLLALPALVAQAEGAGGRRSGQAALPLIGPLVRFVAVARFARTLSTMLAAGVPVLTALEIVKKVLNNTVLEKVVEEARDAIREGESIADAAQAVGPVPVDDGAHGRGRRAFGPAGGHAGERRRRLRARRRGQGRAPDHHAVAAAHRRAWRWRSCSSCSRSFNPSWTCRISFSEERSK